MAGEQLALVCLLTASALHAGFQLTVTVLVYPALARTGPEDWQAAHDRHSRRITPLVVLCYGAWVLAAGAVVLIGAYDLVTVVSLAAGLVPIVVTAVVAGPTHVELGREGPRPELLTRLVVADRVRLAGALVALAAAVPAAAG